MKNSKYILFAFTALFMASCGSEEVAIEKIDYSQDFESFRDGDVTIAAPVEPEVFEEEVFIDGGTAMKKMYIMESEDSSAHFLVEYHNETWESEVLFQSDVREELKEFNFIEEIELIPDSLEADYGAILEAFSPFTNRYFYLFQYEVPFGKGNNIARYAVVMREGRKPDIGKAAYFFENIEFAD